MTENNANYATLQSSLSCAVPLWINTLQNLPWEYIQERAKCCLQEITERGDNILFRSKKRGKTATAFNRLAEGIACLAFMPGGVDIFGLHFEADFVSEGERT